MRAQNRRASSRQDPVGGSSTLLAVSASRAWVAAPDTFGLGASSSAMRLTSVEIVTSVSGATPRSTRTRPSPKRIVAACGSTVERSATLPLALRIIAASFGVSSARRRVAARISTIGVGSSSVSTIDAGRARLCTGASYHALPRPVTTRARPRWGTMARMTKGGPDAAPGCSSTAAGADGLEVLLVHPGGPFWAKRDDGAWSIPKGEIDDDAEAALAVARREFREELGSEPPAGDAGRARRGATQEREAGRGVGGARATSTSPTIVSNDVRDRVAAEVGADGSRSRRWTGPSGSRSTVARVKLNPAQVRVPGPAGRAARVTLRRGRRASPA